MEKKLLYSGPRGEAQPYTLEDFDELAVQPVAARDEGVPAQEQISEEERLRNLEQEAVKRGFAQGNAEGFAAGLAGGKDKLNASLERLGEIIVLLDRFRENKLAELLPELIELSLEIAKKIVHKEIELDRDLILSIAEDAITRAGSKDEDIVIKINPLDYEVMITHIDHLKELSGVKNITIEPSGAISPGGCYIETPTGEVDARHEEQVREIEDAVITATNRKM